jgi:hypothetical protein
MEAKRSISACASRTSSTPGAVPGSVCSPLWRTSRTVIPWGPSRESSSREPAMKIGPRSVPYARSSSSSVASSASRENPLVSSAWKSSASMAASRWPNSSSWKSPCSASRSLRWRSSSSGVSAAGLRAGLRASAPLRASPSPSSPPSALSSAALAAARRLRSSEKAVCTEPRTFSTTAGFRSYTGRTALRASRRRCCVIATSGIS